MKIYARAFFWIFILSVLGVNGLFAADSATTSKTASTSTSNTYKIAGPVTDKTPAQLASEAGQIVQQPTPIPAVPAVKAPPYVPRMCGDYQYVGSNARPDEMSSGYHRCPPGYHCHVNGILVECRLNDGLTATSTMTADDPSCHWENCRL